MELYKFMFVIVAVIIRVKESHSCFTDKQDRSQWFVVGSSFYQECHCQQREVDSLKWLDPNGHEIQSSRPGIKSNIYTEKRATSISLHIQKISKTIAGPYKCVITHKGVTYTSTFIIDAYEPIYFVGTNNSQYIIYGQDSLVRCEARGDGPMISWYKGDDEMTMIMDNDKYEIEEKGLRIRNVDNYDNGTYKCTATASETGQLVDRDINVEVLTVPVIENLLATPDATVVVGDQLSIECIAEGFPNPEYIWSKSAETVSYDNVTWHQKVNTLVFDSIKPNDRGTYVCIAFNKAGNTTKEIFVEVLEPPVITEFYNITASEGSTAQIICKAKGRPVPHLTMSFLGYGDIEDDKIVWDRKNLSETESIFILSFIEINKSHEGLYVCHASNTVELVNDTTEMTVLYKPYFLDDQNVVWGWNDRTVNLNCSHMSKPPSTVVWRYNGKDVPGDKQISVTNILVNETYYDNYLTININSKSLYGMYICEVSNEMGKSEKYIMLQEGYPPPAVKNVTSVKTTATTVTFSIEGPNIVLGPPILGFTAEYDESENYKITNIHKNRTWSLDRPFKVEKLKPNTTYRFRFAALNEVGTGAWSESIEVAIPERSLPQPPDLEVEDTSIVISLNNMSRILKWKSPQGDQDNIEYYIIKYCKILEEGEENILCNNVKISENYIDMGFLFDETNITYNLDLVAHNSKGNSSVAALTVTVLGTKENLPTLSSEVIGGITLVIIVIFCIVSLGLVFYFRRKQSIVACCYKKNKKRYSDGVMSRDRKGLLRNNSNPSNSTVGDTLKRDRDNNKTGIITGKHSAV